MTRPFARIDWLLLAYLVASLYFTYPILASGSKLGGYDWDAILFHHASVLKSIFEYGQLPFWNPWYCGGNVLWANPQVPLLTPTLLLALAFPLALAMKLNILLHYLIGFAGMHVLLTRAIRLTWAPAVFFLAATFTLAGGPALHLIVGHATFLPYFYLPWLLFFFLRTVETREGRYMVSSAIVLACGVMTGGMHLMVMTGVGTGLFAAAAAVTKRDWRPLSLLALVAGLAGLLAAPKLLPLLRFMSNPDLVDIRYFVASSDRVTANMLQVSLLDAFQYPRMVVDGQGVWWEYGNYLGPLAVPFIVASFVCALSVRFSSTQKWLGDALALTAAAVFLLVIGDHGSYSPFMLLRRLPLLSQVRLPSRFTLVWALFAVALVGWTFRAMEGRADLGPLLRRWVALVLLASVGWSAYRNRMYLPAAFTLRPLSSSHRFLAQPAFPSLDRETDGFAGDSPMLRAMMEGNRAVLRCNEPLQVPGDVQYGKGAVFADETVMLSRVEFTPNRVDFRVSSRDGGRVFLNERFTEGWRSSEGPLAIEPNTRLAYTTIPPGGAGKVTLRYVPPGLLMGAVSFLLGVLLSAMLWQRMGRRAPDATACAVPQS